MIRLASLASALLLASRVSANTCPSLIWNDEFDGSALDSSKWTPQIGDGCDLGVDLCGWGNFELQWYKAENAVVSGGTLKILAKQESAPNNRQYTSARLRTFGNFDVDMTQPHVRVEARMKVAKTQSLWSAFWMMPTPEVLWPTGKY